MSSAQFSIIKESSKSLARRGLYTFKSGSVVKSIETPGFIMPTSRGVVSHLTPDSLEKRKSDISGLYVAAEDCKY